MNPWQKLRLIRHNPARYLPLALKYGLSLPLRLLAPAFRRAPFMLQEQMDISRRSVWHDPGFVGETGGFQVPGDATVRRIVSLEAWDGVRRDMLILLLRDVLVRRVPGALAELGVYRGRTARLIHQYVPDRTLHLFDTFAGFDPADVSTEQDRTGLRDAPGHYRDTSVEIVLRRIRPANDNVAVHAGRFPQSVPPELDAERFAFVHLDVDLYEPMLEGLRFFYPRMSRGGLIVVHDYNAWPGPRKATDTFLADKPEEPVPMPDKNGSAVIRVLGTSEGGHD